MENLQKEIKSECMEKELTFEELYEAYLMCLKNKKNKAGTYSFVNENLCQNLITLLDELNNRTYTPKPSNCYVITDPALREIYAAEFSDRIVQHFYMNEIENVLEAELVDGCCSCRKNKGSDYALSLLKKHITEVSNNGKSDCYFLKIDLSGYFMSIDRHYVSFLFERLIQEKYKGRHKNLLLFLTPVIFENNPSLNARYKCSEKMRKIVPDRRKMKSDSMYGMAIGNLTSQAASNLNLSDFDKYVINILGFKRYVRYVDDIIIVSNDKNKLCSSLPYISKLLEKVNQRISKKKTKIDTAYHGVPFLGKVSYPYGYQKANKRAIRRVYYKAKRLRSFTQNILERTNSQIGFLKRYNCRQVILNYVAMLPMGVNNLVNFDRTRFKFISLKL